MTTDYRQQFDPNDLLHALTWKSGVIRSTHQDME